MNDQWVDKHTAVCCVLIAHLMSFVKLMPRAASSMQIYLNTSLNGSFQMLFSLSSSIPALNYD